MFKKAALLAGCLLLCGCAPVGLSTEEMLSPPSLSPAQASLYRALESALGTDSYRLKYPRRGDHLSAFVFHDIDGDGQEEVVVFYELTAGDSSTWMTVLDQEGEGGWRSVYDVPGLGQDVDFIAFAPVTQLGRPDILVGWALPGREDCRLSVYSYEQRQLVSVFDDYYNETLLADVDQNGLTDLLLFSLNNSRPPLVKLAARQAEGVRVTSQALLASGVTECRQLKFGQLAENMPAVFCDVVVDGAYETTEILALGGLSLERLGEDGSLLETIARPLGSLGCRDLDKNGLIDVPTAVLAPGYRLGEELTPLYLTQFMQMHNGSFAPSAMAAVNQEAGYLLRFPQLWENNVTLRAYTDSGEWRFYVFGGSLEESTTELCRIKTLAAGDARDRFETEGYRLIGRRGNTEYYGFIPEVQGGYSIGYEELAQCFMLLE